jgi:signal transduction histidine kinase/DNA-binding response OmpR family regulator/ABC-type sugar transport system substrate-binding protein
VLAGWQFAWTATPLSYLDPIFRGTRVAARDLDCNILLGCGMGSWTSRRDSLRPAWPASSPESDFVPIGPWNTDGLIAVSPLHSPVRSRYVQDLIAAGHPVVFIASGEPGPTIVADNRSGILEAIRHLVEHGHQSIAFIAGSRADIEGDTGDRLRAYHDAVETHGLLADPRLVAWGRHLYDGGYVAMKQILASGVPFSAVMASNDESALGAMKALREVGLGIPEDVAIVGFDDRPESAVQEPALSSVRIPLRKMGYRAVESLVRYITGQSENIEPARIPTRLVARASCGCTPSVTSRDAAGVVAPKIDAPGRATGREQLVQAMAAPVVAKARGLHSNEIEALCRRLVGAFSASVEQDDPSVFQDALEAVLRQVAASGDDAHVWQAALSSLSAALERLSRAWSRPAALDTARGLLDWARVKISASAQRQHHQNVVDQRWMLNRLGVLTARLLAALDQTQIYDVLTQHLPRMGVRVTWVALFEAAGDDPVAWTTLRAVTAPEEIRAPHTLHFRTREFPPADLLPEDGRFSLALFPLTGPRGQLGFVAFDTAHLDLCGAITQQVATALDSAQLYREATEGRRMAEEANELKGRFLSTVSHELRTPLNLIVGLSGILLQESGESDPPLPEPYRKDVEHIHASAQLLGGLIGDVLDLASSDAGQLRLANEVVDLSEALRLVVETGRQLAHRNGLEWRADLPESGPYVWGDRTRLRQVALNLINNAVKFTAQGEVRLEVEATPDSVTVAVCDTGLGIPPEEQPFIFDEFRRSERSTALGYGGLGLGLAICRRLVEMHGGTIGVRSPGGEGAGSTFYFTLPTVQPPAIQAQRPTVPSLTEESVLVLTQRAGSGQRLQQHLAERGFDVQTTFVDVTPDWLSRLVVSPPGAIVIDVSATPHQGWSVLKSIKGHPKTEDLPIMFCSLSPNGGSVLEVDYLTKPIELTELTRALDQQWLAPDADRDFNTILVVDDDPGTLEMHARIVQAQSPSHRVLKARNGLEALDMLQREPIDLVLLDLMMPGLDGFGVLEAMRSQDATRDIAVIVLTGQALTENDMARLNDGVATVLSKGLFSPEETLAHIDTALERNRELSQQAQCLVRQAMAYIHEHYAESISRTDLAKHVALNEDYLTACFRKELGVTPITYINRFRVNQAQQLLLDTGKSVTEIALDVGFSDSGYFSRVFRREVGLSPTDYRQG